MSDATGDNSPVYPRSLPHPHIRPVRSRTRVVSRPSRIRGAERRLLSEAIRRPRAPGGPWCAYVRPRALRPDVALAHPKGGGPAPVPATAAVAVRKEEVGRARFFRPPVIWRANASWSGEDAAAGAFRSAHKLAPPDHRRGGRCLVRARHPLSRRSATARRRIGGRSGGRLKARSEAARGNGGVRLVGDHRRISSTTSPSSGRGEPRPAAVGNPCE